MHSTKLSLSLFTLVSFLSLTAGAEALKVFPGWPTLVGEGDGAKLDDPTLADVAVTKDGVKLTGKKEGHGTLTVTHGKAAPETIAVEVSSAGWRMVKVAVAKKAMEPGDTVTAELIEERMVPLCLQSSSMVATEHVKFMLKHRVIVPVQAGEIFSWLAFAPNEADEVAKRAKIAKEASEAQAASMPR